MAQPTTDKDFPTPTRYEQTTIKNESWVNVTTTKTEPDGTVTQHLQIISKP